VAAPDEMHYPVTLAALDAGLHVLCEKPLALNGEQAREMLARAEAAGVVHMVSFTYRWTPHFRYLRSLAARGVVGELYHASLSCVSPVGRSPEYAWRFDASRANGALGDVGPHVIDTARGLCGEIVSVAAQLGSHVERPGAAPANDTAMLAVEFAGGAQGVIQISAVAYTGARGQEQRVALYGTGGTLEADSTFEREEVRVLAAGEQQFTVLPVPDELWGDADRADFFDLFRKQPVGARLFIDAILGRADDIPTFDDGLQAQLVIDAALRSHRESRRVAVER
jgi:predicted dehydrogenase